MSLENQVASLTAATTNLLEAVNVSKATLDQRVTDAAAEVTKAAQQATAAAGSAATVSAVNTAAQTQANAAASSASQANAARDAAIAAAAVASAPTERLAAISSQIHSGTVVRTFLYDTSKDSDGGAWRKRCADKSWYQEPIQTGKWLGRRSGEAEARAQNATTTGANLATNGTMESTTGYASIGTGGILTAVGGELEIQANGGNVPGARQTITGLTAGKLYRVSVEARRTLGATPIRLAVGGQQLQGTSAAGSAYETLALLFTAAATSQNVDMQFSASASTGSAYFDNLQVFEVLAQPVGDFYQNTTDSKYYRLNASGQTEVFRGNTREFPAVAAVIATPNRLVIYDMATPGCPMWMVFLLGGGFATNVSMLGAENLSLSSVQAVNGTIAVGLTTSLTLLSFPADYRIRHNSNDAAIYNAGIAERNTLKGQRVVSSAVIVNSTVNDVAITVLPGAPIDPATGLPVPTIAVACGSGNNGTVGSVIMNDGKVVNYMHSANHGVSVNFNDRGELIWGVSVWTTLVAIPLQSTDVANITTHPAARVYGNSTTISSGLGEAKRPRAGKGASMVSRSHTGLFMLQENPANFNRGMAANISPFFNTGWLVGDNRLSTLSDSVAETVVGTILANDNFEEDLGAWVAALGVVSAVGGRLRVARAADNIGRARRLLTCVAGMQYRVTLDRYKGTVASNSIAVTVNSGSSSGAVAIPGLSSVDTPGFSFTFTATQANHWIFLDSGSGNDGDYAEFDNILVERVEADRSVRNNGLTINGTLTKTPVADAAQLVAYSNWSAANNLTQPYSSALDFGTGEWTVGGWMNLPVLSGFGPANFVPNSSMVGAASGTPGTIPAPGWYLEGSGLALTRTITVGTDENGRPCIDIRLQGVADNTFTNINFAQNTQIAAVLGQTWTTSVWCKLQAGSTSNLGAVNLTVFERQSNGSFISAQLTPMALSGSLNRYTSTRTLVGSGVSFVNGGISLTHAVGANVDFTLRIAGPQINQGNVAGAYVPTSGTQVIGVAPLADRSAPVGPSIVAGVNGRGQLVATVSDGTTTRTVTTTQAYNTAQWTKVRADYRSGRLSISVNGVEVAVTNGAPLLSLNNPDATLTIGNSRTLDAPFPGSLALWRMGATVPSTEQAQMIYRTELQLFQAGAKCLIDGTSSAVTALAYDADTDELVVGTSWGHSTFRDLLRVESAATTVGGTVSLSASGGMLLSGNAGARVYVPAQNLRDELRRKEEARRALGKEPVFFDFDTVSFTASTTSGSNVLTSVASIVGTPAIGMGVTGTGIPAGTTITGINGTTYYLSANATATGTAVAMGQSSFTLQQGYTAKAVYVAEALKREGPTRAYTRAFDGFRETINFGVAPASAVWVSIMAVRSN